MSMQAGAHRSLRERFRGISPQTPSEVAAARERTRELSIREGMLWSLMWGFGDAFVSPFAIFLKAGTTAMALLGTLPSLLGPVASMIGANVIERSGRRLPLIIGSVIAQTASYLPLFLLPLFFPKLGVPFVVMLATLGIFANGLCSTAWTSLMGDVTDQKTRGAYFGRRNRFVIFAMMLTLISAGTTLAWFKSKDWVWAGFGVVFLVATVSRAICVGLFTRHYDPPLQTRPDDYFSFWQFIRRTPKSNFARFTWYIALMNGAVSVSGPFFNVYMLRDLHWGYGAFTAQTAIFLAAQFIVSPWWGRMIDRHGARTVLKSCSILLPVLPVAWACSTGLTSIMLIQALSGCAWSGFNLAVSTFIYDSISPGKRARCLSYYGIVNGTFSFMGGTFLGAWLAAALPDTMSLGPWQVQVISNLPAIFIASGLLRALVVILMFPMFREVRDSVHAVRTHHLLWRLASGEPIMATLGPWVSRLGIGRRGDS